jgi:valyl-tRNA synthetase
MKGFCLSREDTMARFDAQAMEKDLAQQWQQSGLYHFDRDSQAPVYAIDTPPPSVSGHLHLGNVYSYSHTDFIARFRRMRGDNVFYPMGFDDNGLPTERLVERQLGIRAQEIGRQAFIQRCLEVSRELADEYRALWVRLGLSVDWRYTYDTIDDLSRQTVQLAFIDLYRKGLAYRDQAPTIWCPECRTAIAQAEVEELHRPSEFVTIPFQRPNGESLNIATTRPELLPACVAVFVNPGDNRYAQMVGEEVIVPLFGQRVSVLADAGADPDKGTGAVMCCTFGDTADVEWWYTHDLPLREAIDAEGRMTALAGRFAAETVTEARRDTIRALEERGELLNRRQVEQTVRVHERCGTPLEYIVTRQWFIRLLDRKEELLRAGEQVRWYPEHMRARYREWVQNLRWDWLISRQRYYGVPFPIWYCSCGATIVADPADLPVDPTEGPPPQHCGGEVTPESDVMDTWATSSLTPQIGGRRLSDPALYEQVFPMSMRPQAYEIIRTWAFYTIVQSTYHFGELPWRDIMISGWGLAPEGAAKISKSKGGGPMSPGQMLERYSADAVRYWAASTGVGKDAIISEEKVQAGAKLVTKLWNVAGLAGRFLEGYRPDAGPPPLSPADRWILSSLQRLIARATQALESYEYMVAKSETETFFWRDLADNYLEMAKRRLYDPSLPASGGALWTLHHVLLTVIELFAPIMPFITERIYQDRFREAGGPASVHVAAWPAPREDLIDAQAEATGEALIEIATAVRRYKSERALSLGAELACLQIGANTPVLVADLRMAQDDLMSVTRAREVKVTAGSEDSRQRIPAGPAVTLAIEES